ncbi:MAG TPA: hypothetical protein VJ732_10565, partial [Bryobacteraceae bacterium]|nr:hypothetical protein [Bryobacteraceae bacterium]
FGAQGGGGGGGGAARDLAALFDLELDTEKNQYETRQSASTSEEQKAQEIEDALKKLDELARREEQLAQQQRYGGQTAEQKWQQEMLQREAEQLRQQMEQQLAQNGQRGQQGRQGGQQGGSSSSADGNSSSSQSGANGSSAQQSAENRQRAAQEALDRLRQAVDDMKRAGSQSASAADSRRAADRLREATDLLGSAEQQGAGGRLNAMAQAANQLANRQKQQADKVRDLASQMAAAQAAGKRPKTVTAEELDKMVAERQQVTDDLSHLTQQARSAARELAGTQPGASAKLRTALEGADQSELGTRLQRSSDWLRSGNFSDPLETGLTNDLQKLAQQIGDAARALGTGQPTSKDAAINQAMDNLARLRDQLAGLGARANNQRGQGQPGQQQGQPGRSGQGGLQRTPNGQTGQTGQPGQTGNRLAGPVGNATAGPGGTREGPVFGNIDTGDTHISGRAVTPQQTPNPADTQREIEQGLNLLNQVRAAVEDSPEAKQELQALIEEMRNLDPRRFPGNPALTEQMHQQLLSTVDALELQLRRELDQDRGGTIRNVDPTKIPEGYRDSVADYYRKLSSSNH